MLLRSGLIEYEHAQRDERLAYQEYLRFPLRSFYELRRNPSLSFIIPRSWSPKERLPWNQLREVGGCVLLGGDTKSRTLLEQQLSKSARQHHMRLQSLGRFDGGRLSVVEFRVESRE